MKDHYYSTFCDRLFTSVLPAILLSLAACSSPPLGPSSGGATFDAPPGLNGSNSNEIELGKMLFFDPRLSGNDRISCASCHNPEQGFSDGLALGLGISGKPLKRHTPHLYNLAWGTSFFWDGRASSLEEQALQPIQNMDEMGLPLDELVAKLEAVPEYKSRFKSVYNISSISPKYIAKAIAAFERTVIVRDTPFDKYMAGDKTAMSESAIRGLEVFNGKGICRRCHAGVNFTDGLFHNNGLLSEDPGRAAIDRVGHFSTRPYPFFHTQRAFKTPGLRNVAKSAPYMHDGSLSTLKEVVEFYNNGGQEPESYGRSFDVEPLGLSAREKEDLLAFLESLASEVYIKPPVLP